MSEPRKSSVSSNSKCALICGVSGQDGAYLAKLLLDKGYRVVGTSRDAQVNSFSKLKQLGISGRLELESMSLRDFRSVLEVVARMKPDEIYNLAGQTSVGLSFQQPVETLESIGRGTLHLLEVIRYLERDIRLYNAGSSECFGETSLDGANEDVPFRPRSPYAVAKATAVWEVANYREAYNLKTCSGILFNHESPLRPERFVTQKIVAAACRIAAGSKETLQLGALDVRRDWGWAPEYVEAMWAMLQLDQPEDFVIATGESNSLREFLDAAFEAVGLKVSDHVEVNERLFRPTDIAHGKGDPTKAREKLGWSAKHRMRDVVNMMVEARRAGAVGSLHPAATK